MTDTSTASLPADVTASGTATGDAPTTQPADTPARRRSGGGLNGMVLAQLQQLASGLGIRGAGRMRKSALVEAITAAQSASRPSDGSGERSAAPPEDRSVERPGAPTPPAAPAASVATADPSTSTADDSTSRWPDQKPDQTPFDVSDAQQAHTDRGNDARARAKDRTERGENGRGDNRGTGPSNDNRNDNRNGSRSDVRDKSGDGRDTRNDTRNDNRGDQGDNRQQSRHDEDDGGSRRSRRRSRSRDRGRDRGDRGDRGPRPDGEPTVSDEDVLLPVAGILDVLDNYAFVRTSGYLPGPGDVYVSLSMVRRHGLRKGDAVTGQVKQVRDGDGGGGGGNRKEKFNPLVRIETINGSPAEEIRQRIEFSKLTPLYAAERLRLETEATGLTARIIDIVAPIGKGQRGLIVSPSKAGKTLVMQAMANAITTNNPECHLMVVLVDERPEEVTDMQRAVKGEVIASTFDRPATDHTTVAELAIERAKRLVELGHDVVVLLDSITRLGRAYNLAAPASGRILSGGVDSSALYPPKRFFGAARNIEDGGSLTILATALIDTGSKMDEVIFEEFKGTGNMELRLRREFADKRIFPAIDVDASGTRREELLMTREELQIVWKLRRVLSALDGQQALELLLDKLKKTRSNVEFLRQVQNTTPMATQGRRGEEDRA